MNQTRSPSSRVYRLVGERNKCWDEKNGADVESWGGMGRGKALVSICLLDSNFLENIGRVQFSLQSTLSDLRYSQDRDRLLGYPWRVICKGKDKPRGQVHAQCQSQRRGNSPDRGWRKWIQEVGEEIIPSLSLHLWHLYWSSQTWLQV
jgi:hypothetical protein